MKSDFQFSNLLGTVYRQGNLQFTEDGTKLLSPVGNRVSVFDLINNKSYTLNYEHRKDIVRIALNKQGTLLLSIDEDGRAILVNFVARTVLHHFNFKDKVQDLKFSPCGKYFGIACSRFIQIWKTPDFSEDRQFAPFVRHRIYSGHYADVISISWSNDSRFFISTSKDMTSKLFSINSEESDVAMTLSGHRDYVINAFFNQTQEIIYTLSKDGALFKWEYTEKPGAESEDEESDSENEDEEPKQKTKPMSWRITGKNFLYADGKVKCSVFHPQSNLLVIGLSNGEFRIYELPDFTLVQQLSMGQNSINTVNINKTGEWLSFGSSKLGQLLVYEWQSESYILRQQGHFDSINHICYSPDGSRIVTGSDDGKIKVWDNRSGFCLMTFDQHKSSITGLQYSKRGQVLFSSSLDGTVRAFDLIRYRNFRTFTATERIQFNCLAVDPSGEIVCAGSQDKFDIFVWSVQTGQLLDSLAGHEGPISCLSFGVENSILASSSWDNTIRIWNIFNRTQTVEPIEVHSDVLSLSMRPDSKELAISTLDGHITIFDVEKAEQIHLIDGKRDIIGGRYLQDRFESKNSARSKFFTTIDYSFDGNFLIAGGNNNSICLYDIETEVLLKKFKVSQNMKLDGTLEKLNSSQLKDGGSIELIDRDGENSDLEDRLDFSLPGTSKGDASLRSVRPSVKVNSIKFNPTISAFAAGSTEGLLVYSVDNEILFDPFELDIDITPKTIIETLEEKDYLKALIMSFRLNEIKLINTIYESIPLKDINLICKDLPVVYLEKFLKFIGEKSIDSVHLEFNLIWIKNLLISHGQYIMKNKHTFNHSIKLINRFLSKLAKDIVKVSKTNDSFTDFLQVAVGNKSVEEPEFDGFHEDEDEDEDEDQDEDEESEGEWLGPSLKTNNDNFTESDVEMEE
ncbi:periodic tryptophan protein 2 [[Candida] jaroonii]|uniref:Periodic tryptophan protein 2 n=1 Tax=[Candida] jaroonii TaxID=467808 RepID=A0ACA9YE99_9ASCO|nr:periodic tryptophan protein 2 [[Candida] jaroonii]